MIKYISSILNSKSTNTVAFKYLLFFAIIIFFFLIYKLTKKPDQIHEGFDQKEPFVLKRDSEVYDDFYVEVYDELNETKERTNWEVLQTIKMTNPTRQNSVFLDVGSGTGSLVNNLTKRGYYAYGIDSAKAMIEYSEIKYPDINVKCQNVQDSMAFEKNTFTHVLCTNFTIYQIKDKNAFFKNCYFWMMPNGYLILHLVDKSKFNSISPLRKSEIEWKPLFKSENPRVTDTIANFDDFQYRKKFNFTKYSPNIVSFTETFTDKVTNNVRQNEQTYYMEEVDDILQMASKSGFIIQGKVDMKSCNGDENQFLFILERQL
jgi:ubiquinone/menaquinone biosynthesis C-methylase UbiE